jgi:hypothetical protein
LVGPQSQVLSGAIAWHKSIANRYQVGTLDDLPICYRFFKELRNAISHNSKRANDRTIASYQEFTGAINSGKIGGAPVPDHFPIMAVGEVIKLSYRGVVGFSDIILRLIASYDNELASFSIVEQELMMRIKPDPLIQGRLHRGCVNLFSQMTFRLSP